MKLNRTRILVALLVLVVLVQAFPDHAGLVKLIWVAGMGAYALTWAIVNFRARHRAESERATQDAADAADYRQYRDELERIRAQYDPQRDVADPTSISPEFRDELAALHDKHQAMLDRKFGSRT